MRNGVGPNPLIRSKTDICIRCFMHFYLSTSIIFGLDPLEICPCNKNKPYRYINLYFTFIEVTLWLGVFILIMMLIPGIGDYAPCAQIYELFGEDAIFAKFTIAIMVFIVAFTYSWLRRNKINPVVKVNNLRESEKGKLRDKFLKIWSVHLLGFITIAFWFQPLLVYLVFRVFQNKQRYSYEACYCLIVDNVYVIYLTGVMIHFSSYLILMGLISIDGFSKIRKDLFSLHPKDTSIGSKLETLMIQHAELWSFRESLNSTLNVPMTMIYFIISLETCLCFYAFLFLEMDIYLKYIMLLVSVFLTIVCIISTFLMSNGAAMMQDDFQDIRRFAECQLKLRQKLKILNFMKRFGKVALTASVGGFFDITKKFPIKMASTFNSIFDSLMNLRGAGEKTEKCPHSFNVTNS